jgi:hypothetical protein
VQFRIVPPGKSLRFAARAGAHRTRLWTVKATSSKRDPQVIVSATGLGKWFHVTLHVDEAHWHYVLERPGQPRRQESFSPTDVGNGLRRAVAIAFLRTAATVPFDPEQLKLTAIVGTVDDAWEAIVVELLVTLKDVDPEDVSLPSDRAEAAAMGGVQLTDGRIAVLVGTPAQSPTGTLTYRGRPDLFDRATAMLVGTLPDGALLLMPDATFEVSSGGSP